MFLSRVFSPFCFGRTGVRSSRERQEGSRGMLLICEHHIFAARLKGGSLGSENQRQRKHYIYTQYTLLLVSGCRQFVCTDCRSCHHAAVRVHYFPLLPSRPQKRTRCGKANNGRRGGGIYLIRQRRRCRDRSCCDCTLVWHTRKGEQRSPTVFPNTRDLRQYHSRLGGTVLPLNCCCCYCCCLQQ